MRVGGNCGCLWTSEGDFRIHTMRPAQVRFWMSVMTGRGNRFCRTVMVTMSVRSNCCSCCNCSRHRSHSWCCSVMIVRNMGVMHDASTNWLFHYRCLSIMRTDGVLPFPAAKAPGEQTATTEKKQKQHCKRYKYGGPRGTSQVLVRTVTLLVPWRSTSSRRLPYGKTTLAFAQTRLARKFSS